MDDSQQWQGGLEGLFAPALVGFLLAAGATVYFYTVWREERRVGQAAREAAALQQSPRSFTPRELRAYRGADASRPLLLAIKGRVLDVSSGAEFYGVGGPYNVMAGRDASRAFAMMSLKEEDAHADLSGVPENHLSILDDWYNKLTAKYPTCGYVLAEAAEGEQAAPRKAA